jgi:hypothetical protein
MTSTVSAFGRLRTIYVVPTRFGILPPSSPPQEVDGSPSRSWQSYGTS